MPVHPLAQLYERYALSPLIEIAQYLSYDFIARPHLYRDVSADVAELLSDFRFKLGAHPKWPDAFQRTLNFKVICHVNLAGPPLRAAAIEYVQAQGDHARNRQLDAFCEAANNFREQLADLDGPSLTMNCMQIRSVSDCAIAVLRDPGVAAAHGVKPVPAEGWPFDGTASGSAATLVEDVLNSAKRTACLAGSFRRLDASNPSERSLFPHISLVVSRSKFLTLQRAACFGSATINGCLSEESSMTSADLAVAAHKWTLALQRLLPDPVRAWKDLDYRSKLTDLEWGLAPNPVGNATPTILGASAAAGAQTNTVSGERCCSGGGGQTNTVSGEVCCNSGDLDCDPTAILTQFCSEFCGTVAVM